MKRRLPACLLALVVALGVLVVGPPTVAAPLPGSRGGAWMEAGPGFETFSATSEKNYRKAMASVRNADGSVDLWTCAKDASPSGSYITHRRSLDGVHWGTAETTALRPTPGGRDGGGVCDPSVVRLGGYYYLAYSGWASPTKTANDVFVARSTSPGGPFLKWNGNGWTPHGPQAVVNHVDAGYGAWAPSLVVKDNLLYLFNAATSAAGQTIRPGTTTQMTLRVADISGRSGATETWPERLDYQGVAITLPSQTQPDGTGSGAVPDVKFMDGFDEFVAVGVGDPYTDASHPTMWESRNGVAFGKALAIRGAWEQRAGGAEMTSDGQGHLDSKGNPGNFMSYTIADPLGLPGRYDTYSAPLALGYLAPLGAVHPVQAAEPGSWQVAEGAWRTIDGAYTSVDTFSGRSTLSTVLPDSVTVTLDIRYATRVAGKQAAAGVSLGGSIYPGAADQGYTVFLSPDGVVSLTKAADGEEVTLASARTGWQPDTAAQHVRIVKSHDTILVFVSRTKKPFIVYTDKEQPFTAGRLSLVTANASVAFSGISVADNVPPRGYTGDDWDGATGSWGVNTGTQECTQRSASGGILGLMDTTYSTTDHGEWAAGDGAYAVAVKLDPNQPATRWAGVNIVNPNFGFIQSWAAPGNGYLVFMRGNGNVGLWKGGAGQVVADVVTQARPTLRPARLVVVKTGPTIQVFVDGARQPVVNYTDTAADASMAGSFYLTTDGIATFGEIAYAGNNLVA